ncbi:MAG: FAD-dependent oxidoreductase [Clostridium sp.]
MFEHSTSFGAEYLYGNVIRVEDGAYKIVCEDGTEYEAKAVIVATGTQERMMNVPGTGKCRTRCIYCAVCDGAFSAIRRLWSSAAATLRWRKQII